MHSTHNRPSVGSSPTGAHQQQRIIKMVTLKFVWDQFSYHDDESDDLSGQLVEQYEGETIEEACDNAGRLL